MPNPLYSPELAKAIEDLRDAIAKEFRIRELLDWLASQLSKWTAK